MAAIDFLSQLTGNPERARLLRVLVFNESRLLTLGDIAKRAGVTPREAERELKVLAQWGVCKKTKGMKTVQPKVPARSKKTAASPAKQAAEEKEIDMWTLNTEFAHLRPLSAFVHEISPIQHDKIVTTLRRSGRLAAVILSGTFLGDPSRPADLIVAADAFNERRLDQAVRQLEPLFGREIRYAAFSTPEFRYRLTIQDRLIRDTLDYPHVVLLDKTRML